jgi:hypothetical protein
MPPALRHASHLEKLGSNLTPTRGLEYTKKSASVLSKKAGYDHKYIRKEFGRRVKRPPLLYR